MGNLASLAAIAQIGGGVAAAGNAYSQGSAARAQGNFQAAQYNQNAAFADMKGEQAQKAATWQAGIRGLQTANAIGGFRAHTSGNVDVNTGSAAKVQEDAAAASRADQAMIMQNAALQRWGYGIEAINDRSQGRMAKIGGDFAAKSAYAQGAAEVGRYGIGTAYYGQKAGWFNEEPDYMRIGNSMTKAGRL